MTLTVADCETVIKNTLGGAETRYPILFIVNQVGKFLVGMHSWNWTLMGPTYLGTVAGQDYATLPAGARAIVSAAGSDSSGRDLRLTTLREILSLRASLSDLDSADTWGAITYAVDSDGNTYPRLEIYPTPVSTDANAFLVLLRRDWVEADDDTTKLTLPSHIEALFVELLMAFARGYEEEDVATRDERLENIRRGATFLQARIVDGSVQSDYGPMTGGAVGESYSWSLNMSGALPPSP